VSKVISSSKFTYRLPQEDIDDIVWYFNDYESTIGIRSHHEAMVAVLSSGTVEYDPTWNGITCNPTPPASQWRDPFTDSMIGLFGKEGTIGRSRRIRETFLEMIESGDDRMVNVLFQVYGPQKRHFAYGHFGELAPIVDWTDLATSIGGREKIESEMALGKEGSAAMKKQLMEAAEKLLSDAAKAYVVAKKKS
jgi:hypothetical protein